MKKRKHGLVNHLQKSVSLPAYVFKMLFGSHLGRDDISTFILLGIQVTTETPGILYTYVSLAG